MKRAGFFFFFTIFGIATLLFYYSSGYHASAVYTESAFLMNTVIDISVSQYPSGKNVRQIIAKAFDEMQRIEGKFSAHTSTGFVHELNSLKAGETMFADDEALYVLETAVRMSEQLEGAFDITVKPLIDLWGRAYAEKKVPSDEEIQRTLSKVGSRYIRIDRARNQISFERDEMAVDLGGIAKGYAVDRAVAILKEEGVASAIVNAGGDMYCLGKKDAQKKWRIGIRHPLVKHGVIGEIGISDQSVSTSGGYERYHTIGQDTYSHVIDPKTGRPLGGSPLSVTIVAKDTIVSDAFATGISVLGVDRGLEIVNGTEDIEAAVVTADENGIRVHTSDGLRDRYDFKEKER